MADDSVTFRIDGELTIEAVADAFARFRKVLQALGQDQVAHVRWVLAGLDYGSALITARAEPLDDDAASKIPAMTERYLAAGREASGGGFDQSRPLLRLVRDLTEVADEQHRVTLETADDELIFTAAISASVGVGTQTTKSLGTIRGRVETLSHRKGFRFTLYELASDRPVSCYLQPDHENLMRDAWGHIADVTGLVTRDAESGRPLAIRRVTSVDVVMDGDAMGFLRARGAVGGSEPAEAVIRRIRDAG
ncbi:MAG: hypothetical protein ACT4OS_09625 [Acidimicrobiales bacterium]